MWQRHGMFANHWLACALGMLGCWACSLPAWAADVYRAPLSVSAGAEALPAGTAIRLVVPIERQLYEEVGENNQILNPDRVRLTDAVGTDLPVQVRIVRLAGSDRLGCEIRFELDQPLPARRHRAYPLVFQTVGSEMQRNAPSLTAERFVSTYDQADWAVTGPQRPWDFSDAGVPQVTGAWHATTREGEGETGYLVATANGQYSSPVIGQLAGPIDASSHGRVLIRARRQGPTPARLLLQGKFMPQNAGGEAFLGEAFDLYTVDLAGRPEWAGEVSHLALRWGHGNPPTAEDQIHIDWIRLLPSGPLAFLGRLEAADAGLLASGQIAGDVQRVSGPERGARPTWEAFFAPAVPRGAELPEDGIYPQGRRMGLSMYSVGGGVHPLSAEGQQQAARRLTDEERLAIQERYREAGFTMIGPQYELNDRVLDDAQRLGLKAVYTVGAVDADGKHHRFLDMTPETRPDLADVRRQITERVQAVAGNAAIAWWDIVPEEARYWYAYEMDYMQTVYDAVKAADPLGRPVFMYEPGHRAASSLARTLGFQDLSAKGTYTNYAGKRDQRVWVRWSLDQQVEAIRLAERPEVVPLLVSEMFQQPPDEMLERIPAWVHHDVYLGLVRGAKGILTFSLRKRVNFPAHEAYFQAYCEVIGELTGPHALAEVFLFGEVRNQLHAEVIAGPKELLLADDFGARLGKPIVYPSIHWQDLAHAERGRHLVLVSSASEPVTVAIDNLPEGALTATCLRTGEARAVTDGSFTIQLPPLGVALWRFAP